MSNLPPGVSVGDKDAPWNQPDPEDLFPYRCTDCGFVARGLREMDEHEHPDDHFVRCG